MAAATSAGTGAGQNLAGVGMNVNLAPVLDVYYKSGNFIDQYQRSYSSNPAVVSECGQAFITAQQATGVAATAKHFPGLGSATKSQNTDTGPVTLTVSLTKLHTIDEVPYPTAVSAGVKLVMVSWAIYPALDANLPAGLSPTVIGQELRGRNNFTGVTITDALEAGALRRSAPPARKRVTAAGAGMDLILCSARTPPRLRRPPPRWPPRSATASSTPPPSTPPSTASPPCAPGCSDRRTGRIGAQLQRHLM